MGKNEELYFSSLPPNLLLRELTRRILVSNLQQILRKCKTHPLIYPPTKLMEIIARLGLQLLIPVFTQKQSSQLEL